MNLRQEILQKFHVTGKLYLRFKLEIMACRMNFSNAERTYFLNRFSSLGTPSLAPYSYILLKHVLSAADSDGEENFD